MAEIVKAGKSPRSVPDEVGLDAARRRLSEAYDQIRDALLAQSRQNVSAALSVAEAVDVGAMSARVEPALQPATKAEIVYHIGKLATVTRQFSGALNLEAYIEQLRDDLAEEKVTLISLILGCRKVRQTCRTFPSIAEVMEAVRAVESDYRSACYRIENLPKRIEEARAFLSGN